MKLDDAIVAGNFFGKPDRLWKLSGEQVNLIKKEFGAFLRLLVFTKGGKWSRSFCRNCLNLPNAGYITFAGVLSANRWFFGTHIMKHVHIILVVMTAALSVQAQEVSIFVSPSGKGNKGTLKEPCSLEAARTKVRAMNKNMTANVVVYLRDGVYQLAKPFRLTEDDGGSNGFQVTYKAYQNEKPIFSGGRTITGWTYHEKGIYKTFVGKDRRFRQLYQNGQRLTRARTPNAGEEHRILFWDVKERQLGVELNEVSNWKNFTKVEMVMQQQWSDAIMRLQSFAPNVEENKWVPGNYARLTVQEPERTYIFNRNFPTREKWQAYHFENAYEFIDEPGEWYLNRDEGVLYLKPMSDTELSAQEIMAPGLDTLLIVQGRLDRPVQHLQLEGLTFLYSNWTYPDEAGHTPTQGGQYIPAPKSDKYTGHPVAAVYVAAANNITFHRNTFKHLGSTALDFHYGSVNNRITGNVFRNISGNGISIGKYWDGKSLEKGFYKDEREACRNNTITNNLVSQIGKDYYGSIAISCGYTESTDIAHNEIFEVPYLGISVGWGWSKEENMMKNNKIRNNHLYRVMQFTEDGAAIYTLSRQPGSQIWGNYIHDIKPSRYIRRVIVRGIYLDEGSAGITVGNNAIEKTPIDEKGLHMTEEIGFHRVDGIIINDECCQGYKADIKKGAGLEKEYEDIRYR
jgi:hypothetical protein